MIEFSAITQWYNINNTNTCGRHNEEEKEFNKLMAKYLSEVRAGCGCVLPLVLLALLTFPQLQIQLLVPAPDPER